VEKGTPEGMEPAWGIPPEGHRLPASMRLGPVRLQVSDLDRSVDFYRGILGLRPTRREAGRIGLGGEDASEPLVELHERKGVAPVPPGGRPGLYHFAILLPDRPTLGRFAHHLQRLRVAAGASDHLVSEAFYLRDPDGLGIEVYADRPRESWRHRGRELVMGTERLEVAEVIEAGQGEAWTGMPADAGVGHLHLHVTDLGRAEAFYHQALGLDKVVWSYPGALFLSAGGYHHHLGVNTWASRAEPAGEDDARLLEWEIQLPDGRDAVQALQNLAEAGYPVEAASEGGTVRDPWGTTLRIRGG
jgi:catechol 2,3-dioxygenase